MSHGSPLLSCVGFIENSLRHLGKSRLQKWLAMWRLNRDEMGMINNALNEVCNGIYLREFASRMGAPVDAVRAVLRSVHDLLLTIRGNGLPESETVTTFAFDELAIMRNALAVILREIDEVEFETRLGATQKEIEALGTRIDGLLAAMGVRERI